MSLCRFQTVQIHASSKILCEKNPVMQMLLDLLTWLINQSRSRRGSKAFCAEQDNTETESPQNLAKMTVVCVISHWKGGGSGCGSPKHHLQWVGIKHREHGHPVLSLSLCCSIIIDISL